MKTVVMIDSLKPEYIKYATHLKELTSKYQHGELEVPLGFWGGMDTFFHGKSNVLAFFYYTKKSSWRFIKYFTWLGRFSVDVLLNLWNLVHGWQLFRTYYIPLNKLYNFDTDIKKPIHRDVNVKYINFHELDKIAHKHGTKSKHVANEMKRLDKILKNIDWDIIMGDHGMMDVNEFVRVPETDKCFIDSTLARYWGEKPMGIPLSKCRLVRWDKKYGDYIYLANPGIVFLPNYWQTEEVKGMHGYNPKIKDMKSFYIVRKEGKKKDLTMKQLHSYLS